MNGTTTSCTTPSRYEWQNAISTTSTLTLSQIGVAFLLTQYVNSEGSAWPAVKKLTPGTTATNVQRHLTALVQQGWLIATPRLRHSETGAIMELASWHGVSPRPKVHVPDGWARSTTLYTLHLPSCTAPTCLRSSSKKQPVETPVQAKKPRSTKPNEKVEAEALRLVTDAGITPITLACNEARRLPPGPERGLWERTAGLTVAISLHLGASEAIAAIRQDQDGGTRPANELTAMYQRLSSRIPAHPRDTSPSDPNAKPIKYHKTQAFLALKEWKNGNHPSQQAAPAAVTDLLSALSNK
jgi:hypothetical protein